MFWISLVLDIIANEDSLCDRGSETVETKAKVHTLKAVKTEAEEGILASQKPGRGVKTEVLST